MAPEYLSPRGLLERYDNVVTIDTLRNWRSQGKGPPWKRFEGRVVYPMRSLIEWEETHNKATGEKV
jgi:hypothetical protein